MLKVISNGASSVLFRPQGAFLDRWVVQGAKGPRELLFSTTVDQRRASHPCFPVFGTLNPIAGDPNNFGYQVAGRDYKLPRHGFGRDRDWIEWLTRQNSSAEFLLGNQKDAPEWNKSIFETQYPFEFLAKLIITLPEPNKLTWQLAFTNFSDTPAPLDMACHLYLPWEIGFGIKELAERRYDNFFNGLTTAGSTLGKNDFGNMFPKDWQIDLANPNGTYAHRFTLNYPVSRYALDMDTSGEFSLFGFAARKLVVWHDPEVVKKIGPYICVEPVARGRGSILDGTSFMVEHNQTVSLGFSLTYRENNR